MSLTNVDVTGILYYVEYILVGKCSMFKIGNVCTPYSEAYSIL